MSLFASVLGNSGTAYREGKTLVVPSGSNLPANCVKCGARQSVAPLTKTFRWHSPWVYALIFVGVIVYFIAAFVIARKVRIDLPLCRAHRSWRARMNIAGASLLIGSVLVSAVLGSLNVDGAVTALIGVGLALSGLVVLGIVGSSFKPVYIDETCAKFTGACEEFLSLLPSSPVSEIKPH